MVDEQKQEEKKLIVDEDWKAEAQREKEILVAQEKAEAVEKKEKEEEKEDDAEQPRGPLPEGNFPALISTLATQSLFAMGLLQIKDQEKREADLELAKYNIDMLATIEEKTKGNLSEDEEKILANTLSELRMGYVQIAEQGETKAE